MSFADRYEPEIKTSPSQEARDARRKDFNYEIIKRYFIYRA